jgi:OPA family glycerol-3-phosphate transporter-like MFS transporter
MTQSTMIATLAALWAANHYFQSYGALSIVKINAAWFPVRERGVFAGIFGMMIQGGRWLAFAVSPFILHRLPWQWCFWIPAAILGVMWFANRLLVENSPRDAGFPDLQTGDETKEEAASAATLAFVLRKVFASRTTWMIALASMCIGMVRNSVDHWWAIYVARVFAIAPENLGSFAPYELASWAMPACAIAGGLAAGTASDKLFGSRRAPVIFFAFLGQLGCLLLLSRYLHHAWAGCALLAAISFFIQSSHSLVGGAASMDFGGKKAVATAAGLFDGAQYLAGAVVGFGMGKLLDHFKDAAHPGAEYDVWPLAPIPFAVLGALIVASLWNARPARAHAGPHVAAVGHTTGSIAAPPSAP